jgi:hypothetical protein
MGTISKMVQYRMESFRQKLMKLDELTQPGCWDAANYCPERDMKYGTSKLKVLAVVKPQIDTTAATPWQTAVGEHMPRLDIIEGHSEMPAVTSRPGSGQMRLCSEKSQSHQLILVLSPDVATNSMPIQDAKPIEPLSLYPCMKHFWMIMIQKSDADKEMVKSPASPEVYIAK